MRCHNDPKQWAILADMVGMAWWMVLCCLSFVCGMLSARLPERLPRWHRQAWRAWWRRKSRVRGGRPRIGRELIALIRRISAENPLWGAPRIHGELLKLGFHLSQSSVSRYMLPRSRSPAQGWKSFLGNHAEAIVGIDMLCVPTLTFRRLYAFVALGHRRRTILHIEVTDHPTARWLAHQIGEAFASDALGTFLVRDNDGSEACPRGGGGSGVPAPAARNGHPRPHHNAAFALAERAC